MSAKSILIIRCGALGDLVYATSVIDALLLEYGSDTLIDFICTLGISTLFDKDIRVNKVYTLKHKKIPIWLSSDKKNIINASNKTKYDVLINFETGKQFEALAHSISAKKKIALSLINNLIPENKTHAADLIRYTFKEIVSKDVFESSFPKLIGTDTSEIKNKYNLPQNYIIVSPSNSHQEKNKLNHRAWTNEKWIELITKLNREIQVVIIGNKGENKFFNKLRPFPDTILDLVGKTTLPDLVGVISNATALIATDTGTAHIASATDTEVFALIGPTPSNVTGPYKTNKNKVHIISSNQECAPCYKTEVMRSCKDNICMKEISVDMVLNNIKSAQLIQNQ